MLAIRLTFTAGRYHATPWKDHVNEEAPEWPPSPWRLLRALVAVWRRALPQVPAGEIEPLLRALAAPPHFSLPPATTGKSRHYMPLQRGSTALVFDRFVAVSPVEPLVVIWPDVTLTPGQEALLANLLRHLSYLGRSESWCQAELAPASELPPVNCRPAGPVRGAGVGMVEVLCAAPEMTLAHLLVQTPTLRGRHDRLAPPGSRPVLYQRPSLHHLAETGEDLPAPAAAQVVRFRLYGNPLPGVTETVTVGELARHAAMAHFGRLNRGALSPQLSGRQEGTVLRNDHQHAHYLATDEDLDGRLDHLTIWAPGGLAAAEVQAACNITRLYRPRHLEEHLPDLDLVLLGTGPTESLPARLQGPARVWRSATPFVLIRHPKWRGQGEEKRLVDGPEEQVYRELANRGLGDLVESITPLPAYERPGPQRPWVAFRRWRQRQRPPVGGAYGFRITFREPVAGPVVLGFAAHYGLGLFLPETD